ncbi:MAG TPA: hypothetical protein PKX87_07635, partial [Alphaproteobacteria bacterium]|nr:hypothetical protein [Alphaproteobacteria bacterium]
MSLSRLCVYIAGGVFLSAMLWGVPARAEKWEKMVDGSDQSDTIKPYYDLYERNHAYVEDARDHRQALDSRRTTYVAPLISHRASGMNAKGEGVGLSVSQEDGVGPSDHGSVETEGGIVPDSMLPESDVRAFVKDVKEKTIAATEQGDIKALNDLVRATAAPSFVLTLKTESVIDGKPAGTATNDLALDQVIQANEGLNQMSDVSIAYEILSVAIKKDEAIVNDTST